MYMYIAFQTVAIIYLLVFTFLLIVTHVYMSSNPETVELEYTTLVITMHILLVGANNCR